MNLMENKSEKNKNSDLPVMFWKFRYKKKLWGTQKLSTQKKIFIKSKKDQKVLKFNLT